MLKTAVTHRGCQGSQLGGQGSGGHVGGLEKAVVVRQLHHLGVRSVGKLFAAITHIDAPQAAHGVEHAPALGVPNVNVFGPGDDAGAAAIEIFEIRKRMQKMSAVHGLDMLGIDGGSGHKREVVINN